MGGTCVLCVWFEEINTINYLWVIKEIQTSKDHLDRPWAFKVYKYACVGVYAFEYPMFSIKS